VRFGFSGYDARILVEFSSKWRGAHGGAHLGQQTSQEVAVVVHDGGAAPLGSFIAGSRPPPRL
jgi:hypothetical protein